MRKFRRPRLFLSGLVVLVVGVFIFIFFTTNHSKQPNPISRSIEQRADFTLYYPAGLSSDFHFDDIAFDEETEVLTYKYSSSEKTIFFSLQERPGNLNYEAFRNQMTGVREVKTPLGIAYAGVLQDQTISSLLIENTWIFITAGKGAAVNDLEQASKSLIRIDD